MRTETPHGTRDRQGFPHAIAAFSTHETTHGCREALSHPPGYRHDAHGTILSGVQACRVEEGTHLEEFSGYRRRVSKPVLLESCTHCVINPGVRNFPWFQKLPEMSYPYLIHPGLRAQKQPPKPSSKGELWERSITVSLSLLIVPRNGSDRRQSGQASMTRPKPPFGSIPSLETPSKPIKATPSIRGQDYGG